MRTFIIYLLAFSSQVISMPVNAAVSIFACEPEWASLAAEIGGNRVEAYSATTAFQDPHHIEARPSLIAKVRRADLLICSGAELEVGWLPMLQRQAGNPDVMPGKLGFFEASAMIDRLDVSETVDRSMGDVHSSGNPHVHLDPRRIQIIAEALQNRLAQIDPDGANHYLQRFKDFERRWQVSLEKWQHSAKDLAGIRIVVHHRDWVYMFDWLDIETAGALEPKPGLPTTMGHLVALKNKLVSEPASMIVHTSYQNPQAANRFSKMSHLPVVELPYTVGSEGVKDLFSLFDVTIDKLVGAMK
jgi:zinc/manganese transport system substrate-binding protein